MYFSKKTVYGGIDCLNNLTWTILGLCALSNSSLAQVSQLLNVAKIIKADEDTKIGLLYEFFAFGNEDKHDGIIYSDFLRVVSYVFIQLYNYSKEELKDMLQAEYLSDNKLKN